MEQSQTLQVLNLAKQGLTVEEIAQKLQIGKGEVQLYPSYLKILVEKVVEPLNLIR